MVEIDNLLIIVENPANTPSPPLEKTKHKPPSAKRTTPLYQPPLLVPEGEIRVRGEQALWRAVIVQALMDSASNSHKAEAKFFKTQAMQWLCGSHPDFATVCDYAGMEPAYVRRMAKRALLNGCKWRLEAGVSPATRAGRPKKSAKSPESTGELPAFEQEGA